MSSTQLPHLVVSLSPTPYVTEDPYTVCDKAQSQSMDEIWVQRLALVFIGSSHPHPYDSLLGPFLMSPLCCVLLDIWREEAIWPQWQQWLRWPHQPPRPGAAEPFASRDTNGGPGPCVCPSPGDGRRNWSKCCAVALQCYSAPQF